MEAARSKARAMGLVASCARELGRGAGYAALPDAEGGLAAVGRVRVRRCAGVCRCDRRKWGGW